MNQNIHLCLYITGESSRSEEAMINLRNLAANFPADQFSLEVVDVLDQPDEAEKNKIIATPTLIRLFPLPERRIIGDLREEDLVLRGLGLDPLLWNTEE